LSTIGVISEGEYLCPNQLPSDGEEGGGGSAGETTALLINPVLLGHKTIDEFLDDPFAEDHSKKNSSFKKKHFFARNKEIPVGFQTRLL